MMRIIVCLILNWLILFNARAQFGYEINPGGTTITITNYSGPPAVIIPSNIDGYAVTSIGDQSFGDDGITSVWIPYGVTNIGNNAFNSSVFLTNVTIPNSVTTIGYLAFSGAGLTSLTVPNSVTNMGDSAFGGCPITNLIIEDGTLSIESELFGGCSYLPDVVIPGSVINIGASAFASCDALTAVLFQGNAPSVDSTVFRNIDETIFPHFSISNYYTATAYYLPGTTGWDQFMSNTLMSATDDSPTNEFVPTVLWNPTIKANGTNFGVHNGQYGFDITGTTNLPIAIEACNDLAQTNWVVLQRLASTNGLYHFSEPFQTNSPARFYRIGFP